MKFENREEEVSIAMILYRDQEAKDFRLKDAGNWLMQRLNGDKELSVSTREAWEGVGTGVRDMMERLKRQSKQKLEKGVRAPMVTDFHLFTNVARECFFLQMMEHEDPKRAAAFTLERIGLTMTTEEFLVREGKIGPEFVQEYEVPNLEP